MKSSGTPRGHERSEFFSGRLIVRHLPSVSPAEGKDLPSLKRLALPQGELAQFHDSDLPIFYIAALELTAGSVRGNHVHRTKVEHVYVIRGELELVAKDLDSGGRARMVMPAGGLAVIQPGVAHAFRTLREGVAVEFAPTHFDPSDVERHVLI